MVSRNKTGHLFCCVALFSRGLLRFLYRCVLFRLLGRKRAGLLLDFVVSFLVRSPEKKSGLLILRFDVIGDFIMWLGQSQEYRSLFPGRQIVLLGHKRWATFAEIFPFWDSVWVFDPKEFVNDPLYRLGIMARIRRAGFKTVVQPTHVRFFFADAIIKTSGAHTRIGSVGDSTHLRPIQRKANSWYTQLIPAAQVPLTMLHREAEFTRGLGKSKCGPHLLAIGRYLKPACISDKLPDHYYVLFPGSGANYKRWPIQNFLELAIRIHDFAGLTGVICGGVEEGGLGGYLTRNSEFALIDVSGQTSLNDLSVIIERSMFIVCNDTCAIHIAAAVRTPGVCILGGAEYGRCLPYMAEEDDLCFSPKVCVHKMVCFGCGWKRPCVPRVKGRNNIVVPCIAGVTVNQVFETVKCAAGKIPGLRNTLRDSTEIRKLRIEREQL